MARNQTTSHLLLNMHPHLFIDADSFTVQDAMVENNTATLKVISALPEEISVSFQWQVFDSRAVLIDHDNEPQYIDNKVYYGKPRCEYITNWFDLPNETNNQLVLSPLTQKDASSKYRCMIVYESQRYFTNEAHHCRHDQRCVRDDKWKQRYHTLEIGRVFLRLDSGAVQSNFLYQSSKQKRKLVSLAGFY